MKIKIKIIPIPPKAVIEVFAPTRSLAMERNFIKEITASSLIGVADKLRKQVNIEWRGAEIETALSFGLAAIGESEVPIEYLPDYLAIP
jgi:hypothetical protein